VRTIAGGVLAAGAAAALAGCTSSEGPSSPRVTQPAASGAATQPGGAGQSATAQAGAGSPTAGGAAAGGGATSQGAQGAGGTAACATGSIGVKLTAPDAGLGHRSYVLVFTNNGSSTCTLTGYAGAAVTDASGDVLLNAQRTLEGYEGGTSEVTTVSLAPGGNASAVLEWDDAPSNGEPPSAANCPGMAGGYLEITPPNTTVPTKVQPPSDLCTDFQIHPVIAGTAGRSAN
jgi:hypothetical protein